MNTYDLYPQFPIRPGLGVTQGAIALVGTTPSVFQTVRTQPPSQLNSVELVRINFAWAGGTGVEGVAIAFGPADNAALDAALVAAPVFTAVAAGYRPLLLLPTDTGFKARGTGAGNLTWWIG